MKFRVGAYIRIIAYEDILSADLIGKIEEFSPLNKNIETLNFRVIKSFNWGDDSVFSHMKIHDLVRDGCLKEPEDAAFVPSKRSWVKCK